MQLSTFDYYLTVLLFLPPRFGYDVAVGALPGLIFQQYQNSQDQQQQQQQPPYPGYPYPGYGEA